MRAATCIARSALVAALAVAVLAPACRRDPAAPSIAASSAEAYVGRWIVEDAARAPLPLGLTLARSGSGMSGRVTYSGVAYDVTGTMTAAGLALQPTAGGYTRLLATLRRDGRLAVRIHNSDPRANSVDLEFVLRRE